MRIVKLDELDDEERKRILQEQQQRIEQNNLERANIEQRASQAFKDSVQKSNSSNIASKILNGTGFVAKKTGVGVASGALGIAQSQITEMANNANKGKADSLVNLASNSIKSILGISNPMQFANNLIKGIPSYFKETVENVNDKSKTGLEKVITQGLNVNTNIINSLPVKQMIDSNSQILGKINPNASNALMSVNDRIQAPINKANEKLAEESKNYGKITNLLGNAGQSVGNMIPSIATSILTQNPTAGLATMGLSAKGQATQEALNKGVDLDKAIKIGNAKGMIEIGTEMLTGGVNIFGKGALDDIVERGILDKVKNNVAKFFVKQGLNASGEVLEETISDIAGNLIDKGTVDPNATYSWKDWKDTAITTVLTTAILNTLTGGIAGDINEIKQENLKEQNAQEWGDKAKEIIAENQDIKLIDQQIKTAQNGLSQEQKFEYKQSDNQKVNSLREDASKYLNNTEESINYINTLEKIIQDKDIDIRLDPSLMDENGQIANGKYKDGVITINPNSDRAGEFIAIHELTHAIGTDYMRNMVENYRKSNTEFDNAVKSLLENYNTTELTDEAMADVSAQLLGNQEYINNLSMTNPNLFQRIYNEIKYLWHQFRGYTNQNQFINDLQYKWEQAYRNNNNFNESENYSIAGRQSLENIKNDTNTYNQGINSYNTALNLANKNVNNEDIRKQTGWFQDKNGDWKYEFSDEKMSLKNIKLDAEKSYKLEDILNHNDLFTLYPELRNYDVVFDNIKTGGIFKKNDNKIILNKNKINNKASIEGTLIHEIQHAIQNIEGFENGTNSILSKKAYYENLGEIEADDTKRRFIAEKKGKLDRKIIAPESSKQNPQHSKFNKYMNNRNLIDKMKDGLYNYLSDKMKSRGDSYEVSEENMEQNNKNNSENILQNRKDSAGQVWDRIENSEKGSFNLPKNNQKRLNELKSMDTSNMGFIERSKINQEIRAIENGFNSVEDYMKAEKENRERALKEAEKEREERRKKIKEQEKEHEGYQMTHRPTESGAYASDISANGFIPKDVYEHPEWYFDMNRDFSKESFEVIKKIKGNPEAEITIYRATPSNTINKGDWVTLSRKYAEYHNESNLNGKGNIVELKVKAKDIQYAGDDINEFGYFPNKVKNNEINKLTDNGITMAYVRNPNTNTKNYGTTYGQNLEPAGEYMSMDTLKGEYKVPGFEYGTITFKNPLVIEHKDTTDKGWKKDLSEKYNGLTGKKLSNAIKKDGYDAIMTRDEDGNFIEVINLNGIKDNTKYSKNNQKWQEYLEKNFPSKGTRTNLNEIKQIAPIKKQAEQTKQEKIAPIGENVKRHNNQVQNEANLPTKAETIEWNDIERPEDNRKFRKHYKSIIESNQTTKEAKTIAKKLMGTDTYIPETNKGQLIQADQRISNSTPETELKSLLSKAINGDKISSIDIAIGERLIQYYSKTGNKKQLQEAIQATALAGTTAGQTVQAFSLLNHQTPQGQATWIQRSVDKMNNELAKKKGGTITIDEDGKRTVINKQGKDITDKVNLFNLTPEMLEKITNSTKENMWNNIDDIYEELGQQVPKSMIEKIDSWRYFSMLANIRTHARNIIGNFAMGKTQGIKNKVAGAIEGVVSQFNPNMERTHTLALTDKKTKQFSKTDFKNPDVQSRLELNENKYNPQSRLQNARKTFKNDFLENTLGKLFNLNDTLLEAEDGLGLKAGYIKAMNEYLTANKIDVDKITDTQLNKARNYAVEQAKEATFHQANSIASAINQFQNKNGLTKFAVDAILPFKKTPMNVAKAGMEYSPLQIAKSATLDLANLRKGNITINQYIDNLSKGLTGTGIAFAGYALAKAGILKASGSDDKDKEKYDEEQGKQSYSITIGGKTYSLDWLAPTGIPLFIGAEFQRLTEQDNKEESTEKTNDESKLSEIVKSVANVANAGATAINPMSEMSMISGLTSVLSSYNKDNALGDMMTNAGKSYINQFVPTLLGQVAKTTDDNERTTTSTKTGTIEKAVDQTINQIKNKVPGLRQTLPVKTDIWGKDKKTEPNLPLRAFNSFINPATVKNISTDNVDKELNKLYEVNSNSSILPDILQKTLTIDNQKYRLTNKEYADYTKKFGETSYNLIKDLISSSGYKTMTQTQKEEAISNIYSYSKEANKIDYANKNGAEVKPTTLYNTMQSLKKNGGKQSDYLNYLSKTKGLEKEKEKNQILVNSDYSNKTKNIIYSNGTGKNDKLYSNLNKITNVNIDAYLNYKLQDISGDEDEESDVKGKTVSGSKKSNVISYLNKSKLSGIERLYIYGKNYKYTAQQKQQMIDYIKKAKLSSKEQIEVYKGLTANIGEHKDGKYYWK